MGNLFQEIKRRKVFRVAAIYVVVACVLIQVAATIAPLMNLPESAPSLVLFLLIILFPIALFLAWAYEATPDGIRADSGAQSQQNFNQSASVQPINYIILGIVLLGAGFQVTDRFFIQGDIKTIDADGPSGGILEVVRFVITPPEDAPLSVYPETGNDLAISPDGSRVVYQSGTSDVNYQFYLQAIGRPDIAPLRGTEGGISPFFSRNGDWVGFTQIGGGRLLRVSVLGGTPVSLMETEYRMAGWSWGADDRIVFGTIGAGLFSVAGEGGEPEILTTLDTEQGESGHIGPHVIDREDLVLFVINAGGAPPNFGQLAVLDRGNGEVTRLGLAGISPRYVSTGHIVYATSDGSVRAVPFDIDAQEVTGSPVALVEGVSVKTNGAANFDISDNGHLVYALEPGAIPTNLVKVERDGTLSLLAPLESIAWWPRYSRDGSRVAYALSRASGESDLWVLDVSRGGLKLVSPSRESTVSIPSGRLTKSGSCTRTAFSIRTGSC